jgi:hypothetical protein
MTNKLQTAAKVQKTCLSTKELLEYSADFLKIPTYLKKSEQLFMTVRFLVY